MNGRHFKTKNKRETKHVNESKGVVANRQTDRLTDRLIDKRRTICKLEKDKQRKRERARERERERER